MTPSDGVPRFAPSDVANLLVLSSAWGLSFLFIAVALTAFTPLWIVAGRTLVGGLVLLVVLALRRGRLPRGGAVWAHLLVLGTLNNAVPWTAVAYAQRSLPSGLTALLMALVPLSTLLVSAAIGLERLTRIRIAGLVTALVGVGLIVGADLEQPGRVAAVATVIAATVLYATGAVYAKRYLSGRFPPLVLATGQVVGAAAVVTPLALLVSTPPALASTPPTALAAVLVLGAAGTGLAFLLFYRLIERVGATNATLTTYLIPIVAVIAGVVVLGETLRLSAVAGGLTIVLGIWLTQRPGPTPPTTLGT